jgi:hypothetical protein
MQPRPTIEKTNRPQQPVADLCAACVQGETCNLRQMPTTPVHECNEYDDGAPVMAQATAGLLSVTVASANDDVAPTALNGLCMNCDHEATCKLPRSDGGVWHCEEYQ